MKKKITVLFLLTIFIVSASFPLYAGKTFDRNEKIMQLLQKLQKASGKEKIEILLALADEYHYQGPHKVLECANHALKLSREMNDLKNEAEALVVISRATRNLGNFKKSLEYGEKSLAIFKKIGDKKGMAGSLRTIGTTYFSLCCPDKTIENYREALKIFEKSGDKRNTAKMLFNIGAFYFGIQEEEKALEYFYKSLPLFKEVGNKYGFAGSIYFIADSYNKKKDYTRALENFREARKIWKETGHKMEEIRALNGIGVVLYNQKKYDESLIYGLKVLEIRESMGDKSGSASVSQNIGATYFHLNNHQKALYYLKKALKIREMTGDKCGALDSLIWIANIYAILKNYRKALEYFKPGLTLAKSTQSTSGEKEIYSGLFNTYAVLGDYKKALQYHKDFHHTSKMLMNEDSRTQIERLQILNETETKKKKIELLKKDTEIRELSISKARVTRNTFIIAFVLVSAVLGILFKKYIYLFAFWKKQKYIGRFKLMEKLGSGVTGTVYKAHSIMDKSEIAAVKILKEELFSDPRSKKRFQQEAVIIDKLEHPNIIKIVERGEYKQRLFTVMEFLEGKTLASKLNDKNQPWEIKESLRIMVQISEAVAFIHGKNIIHRDLKPANIMLIENNGSPDYVKLLDFGLARMEFQSRLTQSGNFVGTIEYISPEQLLDADSSPANDVFSLGVIFYRMVCGKSPFPGETVIDVMRQIIGKVPPELKEYRPDIPRILNHLVMKMIDKKPVNRPAAAAVRNALQYLLRQ